jgi:hypothetical protein
VPSATLSSFSTGELACFCPSRSPVSTGLRSSGKSTRLAGNCGRWPVVRTFPAEGAPPFAKKREGHPLLCDAGASPYLARFAGTAGLAAILPRITVTEALGTVNSVSATAVTVDRTAGPSGSALPQFQSSSGVRETLHRSTRGSQSGRKRMLSLQNLGKVEIVRLLSRSHSDGLFQ